MKRVPSACLWDIAEACDAVRRFVAGVDLDRYQNDSLIRSAVERQLQNMGEALSQLSRIDPVLAAKVPRQRQLIAFRNVLVHGYAGLNDAEIWRVVHENLPELQTAVTALAQESGPRPSR